MLLVQRIGSSAMIPATPKTHSVKYSDLIGKGKAIAAEQGRITGDMVNLR